MYIYIYTTGRIKSEDITESVLWFVYIYIHNREDKISRYHRKRSVVCIYIYIYIHTTGRIKSADITESVLWFIYIYIYIYKTGRIKSADITESVLWFVLPCVNSVMRGHRGAVKFVSNCLAKDFNGLLTGGELQCHFCTVSM